MMTIFFYSTRDAYGCFSNFSAHGFELDGKYWRTSEHYYQAQKFAGTKYEELVRKQKSPKEAAMTGRRTDLPLRRDWENVKDNIMRKAVLKKFETHADIRAELLGTDTKKIVEKTHGDDYWGCGSKGTGKNKLGKILMSVRKQLRAQEENESAQNKQASVKPDTLKSPSRRTQ